MDGWIDPLLHSLSVVTEAVAEARKFPARKFVSQMERSTKKSRNTQLGSTPKAGIASLSCPSRAFFIPGNISIPLRSNYGFGAPFLRSRNKNANL